MNEILGVATSNFRELIGFITVGLVSIAWGVRVWMRRLSRDGVETAKDRLEVNVMDLLIEERADLKRELLEANQRTLSADERANKAMRELGRLSAQVDLMTEMLRHGEESRLTIVRKIEQNTELTQVAADKADAAYKVGNATNQKIKDIGLQMADGTVLSHDEEAKKPLDK